MSKGEKSKNIFSDVHYRLLVSSLIQSFLAGAPFFGFTVLNVPEVLFKSFVKESIERHYGATSENALYWLWSALVAATTAGPLIGSFLLGYLATKFGRRDMVMVWNNLFLLLSCAFEVLAVPFTSYECLLVGRFINGICIGMWSFVPVYIAECSPDSCRGLMSMTVGIGRTFWLLMGAVLGLSGALGTHKRLPYLLLFPAIPAIIHILLTPLFPKSPKFLYISEQKKQEAEISIKFFHGDNANLVEVLAEYEREAELTHHSSGKNNATLLEVLKTRHLRWPVLICVVSVIGADCSGTDITNQYSSGLLKQFGFEAEFASLGTILTLLPPLFLSIFAPFVVEFFGRRKIILFGISTGLFSVSVLFVAGFLEPNSAARNALAIVGMVASYVGIYTGFGIVTGILPGELAPEGSRSVTAALGSLFTWIPSFIILFVFPQVDKAIASYSYLPFVFFGAICGAFLFVFMPETKGRPVDEIIDRWVVKKHENIDENTPLLSKM